MIKCNFSSRKSFKNLKSNYLFTSSKRYFLSILMLFLLVFSLTACGSQDDDDKINENNKITESAETDRSHSDPLEADSSIPGPTTETEEPLEPDYTEVTLAMVGDMLLHDPVNGSGKMPDGTLNYDHLFTNVKDEIQSYDIAMVNQEVILGGSELGLSGYPTFNGAYEVADSLVKAGFNVILHATNHTLDKGKTGVINCMDYWETNYSEVAVLGINESQEAQDNNIYIYEKDDLKIAILNYTYGTNGIPLPSDMPYIVNLIDKDKIERDVKIANEIADFVIVSPHWGTEYMHTPSDSQIDLANFMADIGVDLVIGTHPHVIQPVEWIESENGNKMLIYYSIGNYVNATSSTGDGVTNRMIGAMADVIIRKDEGEDPYISDYGAIPLISHKDTSAPGLITVYDGEDYSEELAVENEIVQQDSNFSYRLCMDIWNDVYPEFDK